ncbi:MAG: hypothetical protein QM762_13595 [Chryseolinea sp.]
MIELFLTTVLTFSLSLVGFYLLILVVSGREKFKRLRKNKTKYSIILSACIAILFVLIPPLLNNNTATIKSDHDQFIVTLTAKRTGLESDPRSVIKQPYNESLILTAPKKNLIISAQEFIIDDPEDSTRFTGRLIVGPWKITVDFYHKDRPTRWNGDYRIVKQKLVLSKDGPQQNVQSISGQFKM